MKKRWIYSASAALFWADQIMKTYAEDNMERGEEKELGGAVLLRHVRNSGMCMNLLGQKPKAVCLFSAAAAGAVTLSHVLTVPQKGKHVRKIGLTLLMSGAWSNTFDRFYRGYVVDYIGFKSDNRFLSDITYNLADFLIGAGILLTAADTLLKPHSKKISKTSRDS